MAIPDYQKLMLPLLKLAGDQEEHSLREAVDALADEFGLTEAERKTLLPSGQQEVFHNRVGWARTYLVKADLLEATRRGHFKITPRGLQALADDPPRIDVRFLEQFAEFRAFKALRRETHEQRPPRREEQDEENTPEERLESAYSELRESLAGELLERVKNAPPSFFEKLVVELLLKMGYGGNRRDAGRAVGRTGDDGIDGIIKEDRLGLDILYIQAKRWEGTVGRPEVQKFAGALQGHRARKGILITTSTFSADAREYVTRLDAKIVLIDGRRLAELMMDYNVGVTTQRTYELKKVDSDYFTE